MGTSWIGIRRRWWVPGVVLLALVARVVPVWCGGGLSATNGYDDGVYFAASTSLVHGQLPYRDYVLLHPPGSALFLTPFALLARLTSDTTGFEAARIAFMVLGALNVWLVIVIGRRLGERVALFAGLFYALFFPAIYVARTITLEELGATAVLIALALLVPALDGSWRPSAIQFALAGAALGFGTTVKIWGVVPLVILLVWQAILARRGAALVLAGALVVMVVVCLPFFVAAPSTMYRYVVSDQIGRPSGGGSTWSRLRDICGLRPLLAHWAAGPAYLVLGVAVVIGLVSIVLALGRTETRVFAILLVAVVLVLLDSPSFFDHYAGFAAPPAALVIAAAADRLAESLAGRVRVPPRTAVAVAVAIVTALALPGVVLGQGVAVPRGLAAAAARVPGCVTADDPTVLILMNAQTRDLHRHCRVWVDVTGITYDRAGGRRPDNGRRDRQADARWQQEIMGYLRSGNATIVTRPDTDLTPANLAAIDRLRAVFASGPFVLRATR